MTRGLEEIHYLRKKFNRSVFEDALLTYLGGGDYPFEREKNRKKGKERRNLGIEDQREKGKEEN